MDVHLAGVYCLSPCGGSSGDRADFAASHPSALRRHFLQRQHEPGASRQHSTVPGHCGISRVRPPRERTCVRGSGPYLSWHPAVLAGRADRCLRYVGGESRGTPAHLSRGHGHGPGHRKRTHHGTGGLRSRWRGGSCDRCRSRSYSPRHCRAVRAIRAHRHVLRRRSLVQGA
jgi:hypothetical protein